MPATETSLPPASDSASNSASDSHSMHAVALKLPEFWADNAHGLLKQKLSLQPNILLAAKPSFITGLLL